MAVKVLADFAFNLRDLRIERCDHLTDRCLLLPQMIARRRIAEPESS